MRKLLLGILFLALAWAGNAQIQNSNLSVGIENDIVMSEPMLPGASLTSGTLTTGSYYQIGSYVAGDDFTNVGAFSNASGQLFKATGTTPTTWTNGTLIREINQQTYDRAKNVKLTANNVNPTMDSEGHGVKYYGLTKSNSDKAMFANNPGASSLTYFIRARCDGLSFNGLANQASSSIYGWTFFINDNGAIRLYIGGGASSNSLVSSGVDYRDDEWHVFAFTYTSGTRVIYADGVSIANDALAVSIDYNSEDEIDIGLAVAYFDGEVSHSYLIPRAIPSDTIAIFSEQIRKNIFHTPPDATHSANPSGMDKTAWIDHKSENISSIDGPTLITESYHGALRFYGDDSYLMEDDSEVDGTGGKLTSGVVKAQSWGESSLGAIINSAGLNVWVDGTNERIGFTRDNSTSIYSANNSIELNKWYFFAITSDAAGITNIYLAKYGVDDAPALSGSADQSAGTPVDGGDLYIGNRAALDRGFDGVLKLFPIYDLDKIGDVDAFILNLYNTYQN